MMKLIMLQNYYRVHRFKKSFDSQLYNHSGIIIFFKQKLNPNNEIHYTAISTVPVPGI